MVDDVGISVTGQGLSERIFDICLVISSGLQTRHPGSALRDLGSIVIIVRDFNDRNRDLVQ